MNEFNLDNDIEIGTSVKKLHNVNKNDELIDLIKDLEDRLDNLEESKSVETIQVFNEPKKNKTKTKLKNDNTIKTSEIIIYMIVFILLNNQFTITMIYKILNFDKFNNPYPNLILRTILFGLIIYLYKKFVK